eukprot:1065585-Amorphochlora_amoeboformis.AAC.1
MDSESESKGSRQDLDPDPDPDRNPNPNPDPDPPTPGIYCICACVWCMVMFACTCVHEIWTMIKAEDMRSKVRKLSKKVNAHKQAVSLLEKKRFAGNEKFKQGNMDDAIKIYRE